MIDEIEPILCDDLLMANILFEPRCEAEMRWRRHDSLMPWRAVEYDATGLAYCRLHRLAGRIAIMT